MTQDPATYDDFLRLRMTVGKVVEVQDFDRARKPSYKVWVDFGPEVGIRPSSVQARADAYPILK